MPLRRSWLRSLRRLRQITGDAGQERPSRRVGDAADRPGSHRSLPGCPVRRDGSAPQGRSPARARPGAAEPP
jgi:hypothetical protein